jgi:hypothetical protein
VYRVNGEGVESKQIVVTARAQPISFEGIKQNLTGYENAPDEQGQVAQSMLNGLNELEQRLKNDGNVSGSDLSRTTAAGRAAILLLDSLQQATQARQQNGPEAAQEHVVRAAATLNVLESYVERIENQAVRSEARTALTAADAAVSAEVSTQQKYYRQQLEGDESTLERATWTRRLAQLAELRGNTGRASQLSNQADAAFANYSSQVRQGVATRQRARTAVEVLEENATMVILGQPLVLNPAKLDAVDSRIDRIDRLYGSTMSTYREAGATSEVQSVQSERQQVARRLQRTQYGLWGATGFYGLVIATGLFRTARNLYDFFRDRRILELGSSVQ